MAQHFLGFKKNLIWNYGAFLAMALTGVVLNIGIGLVYGAAALGIFNLLYAIYVIASQACTMGLHYSTLKAMAETDDKKTKAKIVYSSLLCGLVISAACAFVVYLFRDLMGSVFSSDSIAKGIPYIALGLVFITWNKIILWAVNGEKRMVLFAIMHIFRAGAIIASAFALITLEVPAHILAFALTIGDGALMLFSMLLLIKDYRFSFSYFSKHWMVQHCIFGAKALWGGIIIETHFRVDVLMLGVFMNETMVGIYSFAAMIAEGFFQVLFVIRTLMNPIIVKFFQEKDFDGLRNSLYKTAQYLFPAMGACIVITALIFKPFLHIANLEHFNESYMPLLILMAGITISAPVAVFSEIFMQAGKSGRYSQYMTALLICNVTLNYLFIQSFGMIGAAWATGSTFVLGVFIWAYMCKKYLDFNPLKQKTA